MEKINIAELLKDCPKGTKLYSPLCGECTLFKTHDELNKIKIAISDGRTLSFYQDGTYFDLKNAECMLFPSKENRDWSTFQRPFKDGDIVVHTQNNRALISILKGKEFKHKSIINPYCVLWDRDEGLGIDEPICFYTDETRFATEEEKQKLFDAIKANGYKWNVETKTLEKLIDLKFKAGDRIKKKGDYISGIITNIDKDNFYKVEYNSGSVSYVNAESQDNWELVPEKFDIYLMSI